MEHDHLLASMLALSQYVSEIRSLEPLLDYAMEKAVSLVGGETGYLVLLTGEGKLRRGVCYGDQAGEADAVSTTILNRVLANREPALIRNAAGDARFAGSASILALNLRSVLCVPLVFQGQTLGAIYIENRQITGQFTEDHLAPLTMFANQVAAFIQNARLNDDLEAQVLSRTQELSQSLETTEKAWTQAVEANRDRMQLLATLAHDFRSPLSIAYGALDLLCESDYLNTDDRALALKACTATGYLRQLTDNLLDLSRLEAGALDINPKPVDLSSFLSRVFDICKMLPWATGVDFRLALAEELPTIRADVVRLQQIVMNLVSNAQDFTTSGFVELYARPAADGGAVIGVRDSGEGIACDQLDVIFERFRQADGNWSHRQRGAGLGLAICRDLVALHGGEISVQSTVGEGSDFQFTLPPAPAALAHVATQEKASA